MKRHSTLFLLLSLLILSTSCHALEFGPEIAETPCTPLPEQAVIQWFKTATGKGNAEVQAQMQLADILGFYAESKTWATDLTLDQFSAQARARPLLTVGLDDHFTNMIGVETSGGYSGKHPLDNLELSDETEGLPRDQRIIVALSRCPRKQLEYESWKSAQYSGAYLRKFRDKIDEFGRYVKSDLKDQIAYAGYEGAYHMTHAELKVVIRRIVSGALRERGSLSMSVSRHVCDYCQAILLYLATNGMYNFDMTAPRVGGFRDEREELTGTKHEYRPQYIWVDGANRRLTEYKRLSNDLNAPLLCRTLSYKYMPKGLEEFIPPPEDNIQP